MTNTTATTFQRAVLCIRLSGKSYLGKSEALCRLTKILRAISRDPDMFPDPEAFNPLRWVEPEFPTYQEPLTQFPTIINSTQFGYGRRTCQGQTVTDEDLLIGIGSIAWLFNISKAPSKDSDESTPKNNAAPKIGLNEKASISNEELNAGIATAAKALPNFKPLEWGDLSQKPDDPTLDYSILLIAKPIPFSFQLLPRDAERAGKIRHLFHEGVKRGEYTDSREYWGENQGRDKPIGWGKV